VGRSPVGTRPVVGLQSLWCYNYFRGRLELFDLDMKSESVSLLNLLTLRLSTARPVSRVDALNPPVPYLETYHVTALHDRRFRRRSSSAAITLLGAACCIQAVRYFSYDFLPLNSAITAACLAVLIRFGLLVAARLFGLGGLSAPEIDQLGVGRCRALPLLVCSWLVVSGSQILRTGC
jgi:hypothetical protein